MATRGSRRSPTVATLRAVEDVLREAAVPLSRHQILKALPSRVAKATLDEALEYLADHDLVYAEGPGGKVVWVHGSRQFLNRVPKATMLAAAVWAYKQGRASLSQAARLANVEHEEMHRILVHEGLLRTGASAKGLQAESGFLVGPAKGRSRSARKT